MLRKVSVLLAAAVLAAGCGASQRPSTQAPRSEVPVETSDMPPPPLMSERMEARSGFVWTQGHWTNASGEWHWLPGRWESERPGHVWQEGRWQQRGKRWHRFEGRWVP
jgi:hypothetical protein